MKKALTTISLAMLGIVSFAQQDMQFSQNMFNRLSINPGYAGTNKSLCGTALYRTQWVNFPGQPKQLLLCVDGFFAPVFGGVGLTLFNDQLGNMKTTVTRLAYSFHLPLQAGILGIGLEAGMLQMRLVDNWVFNDINDPKIPNGLNVVKTTYDLGLGLYYTIPQKLYVGISSAHLPQQDLSFKTATSSLKSIDFKMVRHYYLQAGYTWANISGSDFSLLPSVLVKTDAVSTQFDGNLLVDFKDKVWAGASYRMTDAIVALVGYHHALPNGKTDLKIGYSFDITTSQLKNYSSNTHEIMLGFCHKIIQNKEHLHQDTRFMN